MYIKLPKRIEFAVLDAIGYKPVDDDSEEVSIDYEEVGNVSNITKKTLKDIEDDWVKSYIIN